MTYTGICFKSSNKFVLFSKTYRVGVIYEFETVKFLDQELIAAKEEIIFCLFLFFPG